MCVYMCVNMHLLQHTYMHTHARTHIHPALFIQSSTDEYSDFQFLAVISNAPMDTGIQISLLLVLLSIYLKVYVLGH